MCWCFIGAWQELQRRLCLHKWISGIGLGLYTLARMPGLRVSRSDMRFDRALMTEISHFSLLTCMQQSVMNFGILMVQGLVNSFGPSVMAAFAAAVKIDSFAYMPCRNLGTPFPPLLHRTLGQHVTTVSAGVFAVHLSQRLFSHSSCPCWFSCLPST